MTASNLLSTSLADEAARLSPAWRDALAQPAAAQALAHLQAFLDERLQAGAIVYPARPFRALELLAPEDTRVVILGQDPYHGPGQAQGLAFSVPNAMRRPPSLRNMFLEIASEDGVTPADAKSRAETMPNDLTRWARQGVLLLNTSLTVEDGQAGAHAKRGWEAVTDALIQRVAALPTPKVFLLWGAHAQAKAGLLPADGHHRVLMANHPSPLSARRPPVPFLGCDHFRQANAWLAEQGAAPIDWEAPAV